MVFRSVQFWTLKIFQHSQELGTQLAMCFGQKDTLQEKTQKEKEKEEESYEPGIEAADSEVSYALQRRRPALDEHSQRHLPYCERRLTF